MGDRNISLNDAQLSLIEYSKRLSYRLNESLKTTNKENVFKIIFHVLIVDFYKLKVYRTWFKRKTSFF
jgi:hypothetical protein